MVVLNKILETMAEKGVNQKELCAALEINGQAFTNWKNGHTKSYKKYLPQIAAFLGVSVDYLLGMEDKKDTSPEITDLESKLLSLFRGVPDEDKKTVVDIIEAAFKNKNNRG